MTTASSRTPEEHPWWAEELDPVVERLETSPANGLDAQVAERRLQEHGRNELERDPLRSPWLVFGAQFTNTLIVVLLVAAAVTVIIGDRKDAIVIGAIVVLNAIVGFVQEYRAERALAALRDLAAPSARVVRGGRVSTVSAELLVPGDVIVLEPGDVAPADARLAESAGLRASEAALTGESVPVDKTSEVIEIDAGRVLADRVNMVFKGTEIVHGTARAIVVATGMRTALGQIAGMLKAQKRAPTPLQRRLAVLGRRLAVAALVLCAVVFGAGVLRGEDLMLMLLTAVSLAVAAVPEALPAVVTIALALGAQRMARRRALVRKLPAVETLGSVTVICTDKTGTLTESRMMVERVWTPELEVEVGGTGYAPTGELRAGGETVEASTHDALGRLLLASVLCNNATLSPPGDEGGWSVVGDPTEGALLALGAKAGLDPETVRQLHPRLGEIPFDSERKRMTTAHEAPDAGVVIATKGAVEVMLDVAGRVAFANGERPLTEEMRARVLDQAEAYAADGYRVLAVAGRPAATESAGGELEADVLEHDQVLYGLVAMADPPRPESAAAVGACKAAGITPVLITGDHPDTARAIASRLGIVDGKELMTGAELAAQAGELTERVERVAVYARTSPAQKLDIVDAWKQRGGIVAMTGDGVNDAPAVRAADIGVAMGVTGTEVAKEAADMVLLDDNFATIVTAVREGRRIYDNIRRFVRYTLTSNTGEIWVMLLGPFFGLSVPLLPVHILWINLVTDGLPGLALGIERAERDVMKRPPRPPTESVFARGLWQHVLLVGLIMGAIPLALGVWGYVGDRPWQTMVFSSLAMLQLGNALAVRSEIDSLLTCGLWTNRPLLLAVAGTLAVQLLVVYWPPLQGLLRTEALSLFELAVVGVASTGVFWAVELEKAIRRRLAAR